MTLKQLTSLDRITFLKKFTIELLLNTTNEEREKQRIKVEKLRQKFLETKPVPEQAFKKIINSPIFTPQRELEEKEEIRMQKIAQMREIQEKKKMQKLRELKKRPGTRSIIEKLRRPIFHRVKMPKKVPIQQRKQMMAPKNKFGMQRSITQSIKQIKKQQKRPPVEDIRKIRPEAEQRPPGFALGKIEQFLRDGSIQLIECSGPGRKVLVKRLNKINTTQLILNQAEVTDVINEFSTQAKIPVMGGILKAAVGDLVISAVVSEFVGSRFIINKITPYSIIQ